MARYYELTDRGKSFLSLGYKYDGGFENSKIMQLLTLINKKQTKLETLEEKLYGDWIYYTEKVHVRTGSKKQKKRAFRKLLETAIEDGYLVLAGNEPITPKSKATSSKYSQIKNALDNSIRKAIFDYVEKHPGAHYSKICRAVNLGTAPTKYHLSVLVDRGFINSKYEGYYHIFYLPGQESKIKFYSKGGKLRERILTIIKENPGISQKKLAKKLKQKERIIYYQYTVLLRDGKIKKKRVGREKKLFIKKD